MRVMVVVMVPSQHETFKVSDGSKPVNSENSMRLIWIPDSNCSDDGWIRALPLWSPPKESNYSFS